MHCGRFISAVISCCALALSAWPAYAVKAVPNIVKFRQPDGSHILIRIFGDERFGYVKTKAGYLAAKGNDGYLHYANYNSGALKILPQRVAHYNPDRVSGVSSDLPVMVSYSLRRRGSTSLKRDELSKAAYASSVSSAASSAVRSLVLLVQFSDVKFSSESVGTQEDDMLNKKGYSFNGATGCAAEYFKENACAEINFDISPVITLSGTLAYYGADTGGTIDANANKLIADACAAASSAGVKFSNYDCNNDGIVDNVALIIAGYDQAENGAADAIWSRQANADNLLLSYDGKKISSYTFSSELAGSDGTKRAGIGVFCHEFSHTLGLMDMYDTNGDEEGAGSGLLGTLSIMDEGCYLNGGNTPPYYCAIEREMLGTAKTIDLEAGKSYEILAVTGGNSPVYRIKSSTAGEYFLLECRGNSGWDKYVGGCGLAVYHVDKSSSVFGGLSSASRWTYNNINAFAQHQCAALLADAAHVSDGAKYALYPGSAGIRNLDAESVPALLDWNNLEMGVSIYDIAYSGGTTTFSAKKTLKYDLSLPKADNIKIIANQTSASLSWSSSDSRWKGKGHWRISWGLKDSEGYAFTADSDTLAFTIPNLLVASEYKVRGGFATDSTMGAWSTATFTTQEVSSDFSYVKFLASYKVGDFIEPAIMNVGSDAVSFRWTVNSIGINMGENYKITAAGCYTVKVYIGYADGSEDVITKKIAVK